MNSSGIVHCQQRTGFQQRTVALVTVIVAFALAGCGRDSGPRISGTPPPNATAGQVGGAITLDGRPFDGPALLRLVQSEAGQQATQSTSDGRFFFPSVPSGDYMLKIEPPAGIRVASQGRDQRAVSVPPGGLANIDFVLTEAAGAPGDSLGTPGEGAWLKIHVLAETGPVSGLQVEVREQSTGEEQQVSTGPNGDAGIYLRPGTYAITANTVSTSMPWFKVDSIQPPTTTIVQGQSETPMVNITLARDLDVPLPKAELSVWIGADSLASGGQLNPPVLPSVHVRVLRAGSEDLVIEGDTGTSHVADFQLDAGAYDVWIDVPPGFALNPNWENPSRNLQVAPLGHSWTEFMLKRIG
jgi:hypothetical protein